MDQVESVQASPVRSIALAPQGPRSKFTYIEAGRAIAAILVVLYHVDRFYFGPGHYFARPPFAGVFQAGHAGVEFFFVLSGFLIAMVHWPDLGQPSKLTTFAKKRFLRIYPFYWICLFAVIALSRFSNGLGDKITSLAGVVGSFGLIGIQPTSSIIYVSWTLFHEVLFYIVFAIAIVSKRIGSFIAIIGVLLILWNYGDHDSLYILDFINILFLVGVLFFRLVKFLSRLGAVVLVTIGLVLFVGTASDDAFFQILSRQLQIAAYGVSSACILAGLTTLESIGLRSAPRWLLICGQSSYAIYLTHSYIVAPVAKVISRCQLNVPAEMIALLLLSVSVLAGIFAHFWIEKPVISWARRLTNGTNQVRSAAS